MCIRDRLKGEVHYLRAYFYYWLLSQWGGVPLIEKSFTPVSYTHLDVYKRQA